MSTPNPETRLRRLSIAVHGMAATVLLTLFLVAWSSLIRPLETQQYLAVQRQSQLATTLAAAGEIYSENASLHERLAAAREQEALLQDRIPDDPSAEEFLALASELADMAGLKIEEYQPGKLTQAASYSTMEVELIGEGGYASICRFLDGLSKLPRLSTIVGMHIDATRHEQVYLVKIAILIYFTAASESENSERGAPHA